MKRREFLKKSTLVISSATFAAASGISINNLFAKNGNIHRNFSFEIITDKPSEALRISQEFFRRNSFDEGIIKYSEYKLNGEMTGDIVFVNNGKLINYKTGNDDLTKDIRNIAQSLSLPDKLYDPVRLRFSLSESRSRAKKFLVFHKNILIKTLESGTGNSDLIINGSKGNLILRLKNTEAEVINSSCKHKTCVNSGSIGYAGESIVCIPNEILILCE